MQRAWRVGRVGLRALLAVLLALIGAVCAGIAIAAPATATNDYEPGFVAGWLAVIIGTAGGAYLALARHPWRRQFAVFGTATLAFAVLFFATTDWHARADGPAQECFVGGPTAFQEFWPTPEGPLGLLTASGAHLGSSTLDSASVQRVPPGVRCEWAKGSFLVRPDAKDWFVLLGESSAAGFAATGPVLWLMGLARRRRPVPRPSRAA